MTTDRRPATALDRATAAWGADLPDWVTALAVECDLSSQSAAAARLDVSDALVSGVLRRTYKGSMGAAEARVCGVLMAATVDCPVVGALPTDACLTHQRAPWAPHNPQRIQFFRACRACPHSKIGGSKDAE